MTQALLQLDLWTGKVAERAFRAIFILVISVVDERNDVGHHRLPLTLSLGSLPG